MPRPDEYENLSRTKALEAVAPTADAIEGFLRDAGNYRVIANGIESKPEFALQKFTMAYEGYFKSSRPSWSFTKSAPGMPAGTWSSSWFPSRWA